MNYEVRSAATEELVAIDVSEAYTIVASAEAEESATRLAAAP